jgi:Tfp pilus assembly protein PilX
MRLCAPIQGQSGSVLLPALVILALVAFMGVFSMQTAGNQKQMVQSLQSRNASFEGAMGGLRDAESWLEGLGGEPDRQDDTSDCDQPCVLEQGVISWDATNVAKWGKSSVVGKSFPDSSKIGRYYIEFEAYEKDTMVLGQKRDTRHRVAYSVKAQGEGASGRGETVVESVYVRRYR